MKNILAHGDCVKLMGKIKDEFADLVFADPPFNIGFPYDIYDDDRAPQEYMDWSKVWLTQAIRILKKNGSLWLAIGDAFASELDCLVKSLGMHRRSWVIWYFTFGQNAPGNFTSSHTHLFYYTKSRKDYQFYPDAIKVPSARQIVYKDSRAKEGGRLPDNTWLLRPQNIETAGGFDEMDNTWHVPRVNGTFKERAGFHGCQMPEAVLARIIKSCTKKNDLVVDPFCGSGTTPAVAKKLGRSCITFDISDAYIDNAKKRVEACTEDDTVGDGYYATK